MRGKSIRLAGARVATGPDTAERTDLTIHHGPIDSVDITLDLTGCLLLPGLVNAHDHLEFALFPRLGNRIYANASEWASDIYRPSESPIKEHLSLAKRVRLTWGGIRNLLSGVTTVAHHNPYQPEVFEAGFPVHVLKDYGWAHSLAYSPDLVREFVQTPPDRPFIVHAAEGIDSAAKTEIRRLDALGVLDSRTILVHAIGLGPGDVEILLRRNCSIVWCPTSNLHTCGTTLPAGIFESGIPIALGTDSPLTAEGDLFDEIRAARKLGVPAAQIYRMVTSEAAGILRMPQSADLVAFADYGQSPAEAIFDSYPELVIVHGRIALVSNRFAGCVSGFQAIQLESRGAWLVDADIRGLHEETEKALGSGYRLAGRRVEMPLPQK